MTMRRRKMWRFVGRSGFVIAFISLVLIGMNTRWVFGYERWGVLIGVGDGFVGVGIGASSPDRGWIWEHYETFELQLLPTIIDDRVVVFPLTTVAFFGAAFGYVGWKRARRKLHGFCQVCSYDLTGNVSGTCPECGTAVE